MKNETHDSDFSLMLQHNLFKSYKIKACRSLAYGLHFLYSC